MGTEDRAEPYEILFLKPRGGYCPLVGKVGQRSDILKTETRTYTITKTNSKGESEEIEIEDEIQAVIRRKALFAEGGCRAVLCPG